MKTLLWVSSLLPAALTAAVLPFLPDRVPMHYSFSGAIDRWGSKYEQWIFPCVILLLSLFWLLLIRYFERKGETGKTEKDRAEARSNAGFLRITAVVMAFMFTLMHAVSLYNAWAAAGTRTERQPLDPGRASLVLCSLLILVLGNILTKTRPNSVSGVRTPWSTYNDTTWQKSNRFGGAALMASGVFAAGAALLAPFWLALVLFLCFLLAAASASCVYSFRVCQEEKARDEAQRSKG